MPSTIINPKGDNAAIGAVTDFPYTVPAGHILEINFIAVEGVYQAGLIFGPLCTLGTDAPKPGAQDGGGAANSFTGMHVQFAEGSVLNVTFCAFVPYVTEKQDIAFMVLGRLYSQDDPYVNGGRR